VSHPDTTEPAGTTASPRFRLVLAGVLVLALVGSLVWLGLVLAGRSDGDTASRQGDRETVVLRAKEWMGAFGRFDRQDLDDGKVLTGYRDRLEPLVATGFTCYGLDLEQTIAATSQLVAQSKVSTSTSVDRAGVQSIDDDSATVIISGIRESSVAKSGPSSGPTRCSCSSRRSTAPGWSRSATTWTRGSRSERQLVRRPRCRRARLPGGDPDGVEGLDRRAQPG
jgi:hypothetical protein